MRDQRDILDEAIQQKAKHTSPLRYAMFKYRPDHEPETQRYIDTPNKLLEGNPFIENIVYMMDNYLQNTQSSKVSDEVDRIQRKGEAFLEREESEEEYDTYEDDTPGGIRGGGPSLRRHFQRMKDDYGMLKHTDYRPKGKGDSTSSRKNKKIDGKDNTSSSRRQPRGNSGSIDRFERKYMAGNESNERSSLDKQDQKPLMDSFQQRYAESLRNKLKDGSSEAVSEIMDMSRENQTFTHT